MGRQAVEGVIARQPSRGHDHERAWTLPDVAGSAEVVIRETDALRALLRARGASRRAPVRLEFDGLSESEGRLAGERLTRWRLECGCTWGAVATVAGLVVMATWLVLRFDVTSVAFVLRLPVAIGAVVACAGLGKAVGVARARWRFRREVNALLARVSPMGEG